MSSIRRRDFACYTLSRLSSDLECRKKDQRLLEYQSSHVINKLTAACDLRDIGRVPYRQFDRRTMIRLRGCNLCMNQMDYGWDIFNHQFEARLLRAIARLARLVARKRSADRSSMTVGLGLRRRVRQIEDISYVRIVTM